MSSDKKGKLDIMPKKSSKSEKPNSEKLEEGKRDSHQSSDKKRTDAPMMNKK